MDEVTFFPLTLIDVSTRPSLRLQIGFRYTDMSKDYNVMLERGVIYEVVFLHNGKLLKIVGKILGVAKLKKSNTKPLPRMNVDEWLVRIDGSTTNSSLVVDVVSSQLRRVRKYVPHMDEDNTIASGTTHGGITYGDLNAVTVKEAKVDTSGNITDGKIDGGNVGPSDPTKPVSPITVTEGGCTQGHNGSGNDVVVENGKTTGGKITGGTISAGKMVSYDVDAATGDYINCVITNAVVTNSTIVGGKTTGGTIIDAVISDAVVTGGVRSGSDMVTKGVTVVGDVGIGGYSEGGTYSGGTAVGEIDGKMYTIYGGTATGGRTSGGTIFGGVVSGGSVVGGATINATVTGGSNTGGTTIGAKVIVGNGYIVPGSYVVDPGDINIPVHPEFPMEPIQPVPNDPSAPGKHNRDWDGLIVFDDENSGIGSNISTWDGRPGSWI